MKLRCRKCGNKREFRKRVNYPFGRKSNKRVTYECKRCGAYVPVQSADTEKEEDY